MPTRSAAQADPAPSPANSVVAEALTKLCKGCQRHLPLSAFHRNRTRLDGVQVRCRDCTTQRRGQHQTSMNARIAELERQLIEARAQVAILKDLLISKMQGTQHTDAEGIRASS